MKHAYLIIAHNRPEELSVLMRFIDDIRNDIYLLIDSKSDVSQFYRATNSVKASTIHVINDVPVSWGGSSQIVAEMTLFEKAYQSGIYSYYHLLSGVDIPVKTQDYIHDFFEKNSGMNFIQELPWKNPSYDRIRFDQYHLLQDKLIGKKRNIWKYIDFASCYVQKAFGVCRFKNKDLKRHINWVSITHNAVHHLVSNKDNILHTYRYTYCCDEVFLLNEILNSKYAETISDLGCLRFMEWKKQGARDISPRALTISDIDVLNTPMILFARKIVFPYSLDLVKYYERKFNIGAYDIY